VPLECDKFPDFDYQAFGILVNETFDVSTETNREEVLGATIEPPKKKKIVRRKTPII
jgi:hypothetical protein